MCSSKRVVLEVAVQDPAGAHAAYEEGADRVELCIGLGAYGGLTPSMGMVKTCASVGLPDGVQVLVRPRAGDFCYKDQDLVTVLIEDLRASIRAGASGVVIGALNVQRAVDRSLNARLLEVVKQEAEKVGRSIQVTFHRAFDQVQDQEESLEILIDLGFDRVLTSGGAPRVGEGRAAIADLVRQAAGRIQIMAGGGLKIDEISDLICSGVDAIHMSARSQILSQGGPGGGADRGLECTDRHMVGLAVSALNAVNS